MAAVTIRNLPEATHRALKVRAREHGVSAEAEIRTILNEAVAQGKGLGSLLYEISRPFGGVDLDIRRDPSPIDAADFG
jgi:plasmid stability protein